MINQHALITGASSGIGLEISKCLAVRGYSLILVSRRKQRLEEIRDELINEFKVKVDIIPADLEDEKTPDLIYDYCKGKGYFVNLLVNNAGYALPKPFHETPMEDEEKFLRVLGISVVALTKLFIKDMIKEKTGKIMMISSVAAFAPPSSIQTLYGPVKTFINRFSEV